VLSCRIVSRLAGRASGPIAANAELERLRTPKYSTEKLRLVREMYEKQDEFTRDLLREIRIRGFMLEDQATNIRERRKMGRQNGILYALQYNTNLICKLAGDQYQINPEMQDTLDKVLDEAGKA
jgi:hypothetical protein